MSSVKYTHSKGPGFEMPGGQPFAASQRFSANGAAFIHMDSSGHATKSLDATAGLWGWFTGVGFSLDNARVAEDSNDIPEFTTSPTAGTKYKALAASPADVFFCPSSAAFAQARVGEHADLTGVSDNSSGNKQQVNLGTNTTDVLRVLGGVVGDSEVYVSIDPVTLQADT